jgi:hypothetical protein
MGGIATLLSSGDVASTVSTLALFWPLAGFFHVEGHVHESPGALGTQRIECGLELLAQAFCAMRTSGGPILRRTPFEEQKDGIGNQEIGEIEKQICASTAAERGRTRTHTGNTTSLATKGAARVALAGVRGYGS